MAVDPRVQACLLCGGDASEPDHLLHCDGRQGANEALFDAQVAVPAANVIEDEDDPRSGTLVERAERFHQRNPAVYHYAVSICRWARARGIRHYGIGAVWEIMRFKYLETYGDIYKLNNNHRAFYARLVMAQEPDLAGFFQTRDCPHDPEYYEREVAAKG